MTPRRFARRPRASEQMCRTVSQVEHDLDALADVSHPRLALAAGNAVDPC